MKKLAIGIMAVTLIGSSAMFAEDSAVTQVAATTQSLGQTMMKCKKGNCEDFAKSYADQAQNFKDQASKATAKGDTKLAELLTNCSAASQKVADQMTTVMKTKSECMAANPGCAAMMKKQGKECGAMTTPNGCMKMAQRCEKMSQKMANKAEKQGSSNSDVAANAKTVSDFQMKMSEQLKTLASAEQDYKKSQ